MLMSSEGMEMSLIRFIHKRRFYTDSTTPDFYRGYYEVGASNGPVTAYSTKDSVREVNH